MTKKARVFYNEGQKLEDMVKLKEHKYYLLHSIDFWGYDIS